jgi:uncharacterized coiled-coil protein SlyX
MSSLHEQSELALRCHSQESASVTETTSNAISVMKSQVQIVRDESKDKLLNMDKAIIELSRECQGLREKILSQAITYEDKIQTLFSMIATLQNTLQQLTTKVDIMTEEKERVVLKARLEADKMKAAIRAERRHCANLMFMLHAQRGAIMKLRDRLNTVIQRQALKDAKFLVRQKQLRAEVWEQVFAFTRLCTDVDALFDFFAARLANLGFILFVLFCLFSYYSV